MLRRLAPLGVVVPLVTACGSPPAPATEPRASSQAIDAEQCHALADRAHRVCGDDLDEAFKQCRIQARFAEAGGCLAQGQRAFECSNQKLAACTDVECCRQPTCAVKNQDLENCLRGYCTTHGGNPDCAEFFGTAEPATPRP